MGTISATSILPPARADVSTDAKIDFFTLAPRRKPAVAAPKMEFQGSLMLRSS